LRSRRTAARSTVKVSLTKPIYRFETEDHDVAFAAGPATTVRQHLVVVVGATENPVMSNNGGKRAPRHQIELTLGHAD
jgi:hypothetical protein